MYTLEIKSINKNYKCNVKKMETYNSSIICVVNYVSAMQIN